MSARWTWDDIKHLYEKKAKPERSASSEDLDGDRAARPATETEAGFQAALIELAWTLGWRVAHFRPARTAAGWRTAVAADGAGWPDLFLVREDRLLAIEVKSDKGVVSKAQQEWLTALAATACETYVARPSEWQKIAEVLGA